MEQNQEFGSSTTSVPPPPKVMPTSPAIYSVRPAAANRKQIWLYVGIGIVMVVGVIAFFCHVMIRGYRQTSGLVATLHSQMKQQDWEGIYSAAALQYRDAISSEENREMFSGIDRKLGVPVSTKQQNIFVNSNSNGTTIRAAFETRFSRDATATETITWRYWNGQYRLESYNINSMALLSR